MIFAVVALVWLAFDKLTKWALAGYAVGDKVPGSDFGILDFTLVHNTGAAWGMFDNATLVLAVFSIAICAFAAIYLFVIAPDSGILATFSLGLIVAGGIGNAIDRISNGYVIDFIHTTFIEFPVFNVADIGVTCGVALLVISLLIGASGDDDAEQGDTSKEAIG